MNPHRPRRNETSGAIPPGSTPSGASPPGSTPSDTSSRAATLAGTALRGSTLAGTALRGSIPAGAAVSGFTLVELLVTITIMAVLLLGAVPAVNDWIHAAQAQEARGRLVQGYGVAKALALRNPGRVGVPPAAAAGLRVVTLDDVSTLLVCRESPTAAACVVGGASLVWEAALPVGVKIAIGGVAATATVSITSRGIPTTATSYTVSRGGPQNDETGTLY